VEWSLIEEIHATRILVRKLGLNQIGFHNPQTNSHLKQNWSLLNQPIGSRALEQLNGKCT
jgi:hypothetical protein